MMKSKQITEERLTAIKMLCEIATPGPWLVEFSESGECDGICLKNGTQIVKAGNCIPGLQTAVDLDGTVHSWKENQYDYGVCKRNDALFIAEARENIYVLLAEIARLRAREDWFIDRLAWYGVCYGYRKKFCPMPFKYVCEHREGYDYCRGGVRQRAECWRKAADMETSKGEDNE